MKSASIPTKQLLVSGQNTMVVAELLEVANTFVELQQHRHAADYDNSKQWSRTDVLTHVDEVAKAFQSWRDIRGEAVAQAYLLRLLIHR